MWLCIAGEIMSIYFYGYNLSSKLWLHLAVYLNFLSPTYVLSLILFHWKSMRDENWTLWCVYVWRDNSCLLIFTRNVIWLISHLLTANNSSGFLWNVDTYAFVYLLRSNQYVSNQYIMDRNPRLSSYTFSVTYSDYIYLLLVCGDFPLTLKTGGCWNMLESTTARIPLIDQVCSQMESNAI